MSIATEITRIKNAVADAYTAAKGVGLSTPPGEKVADLAGTIEKTPGHYRPVYDPIEGAKGTAWEFNADAGLMSFRIGFIKLSSSAPATIDWGDGTTQSVSSNTEWIEHTFNSPGRYVISVTNNVVELRLQPAPLSGAYFSGYNPWCPQGTYKGETADVWGGRFIEQKKRTNQIIRLGSNLKTLSGMFTATYGGHTIGLPPNITDLERTFYQCSNLVGWIPEIPSGVKSMVSAFYMCQGLTGTIPDLPSGATNLQSAFAYCAGLTGRLTSVPSSVTNLNGTFYYCILFGGIDDINCPNCTTINGIFYMDFGIERMPNNVVLSPNTPAAYGGIVIQQACMLSKESLAVFNDGGEIVGGLAYNLPTTSTRYTYALGSVFRDRFTSGQWTSIVTMMTSKGYVVSPAT